MYKILKRDDFIREIYTPMMEQKEYEKMVAVNEGLLKNLFGVVKNLFKKDWDSIKCNNPELIQVYKELDDNLTGFSFMKLSKKGQCNQIRQELVDFAYDWYDKMMNDAKKDETDPSPVKNMDFDDKLLKSNLEETQNKIDDICGDDEQMKKWAKMLMRDMKLVINRTIHDDIKDENARKELEAMNKEDMEKSIKNNEEINKEMEKIQNDQLREVEKEREKTIQSVKSTSIDEKLPGNTAAENLCGEFNKIRVSVEKAKKAIPPAGPFKKDALLGFNGIFSDEDYAKGDEFKVAYKLMDSFYTALNTKKVLDLFKTTPSQSVQAMCIALNAFIKYSVYGDTKYDKALLNTMAKCAVTSDGTVGFNLPISQDEKTKKDMSYFSKIAYMISRKEFKDAKNKEIEYPEAFEKNATNLLNKIIKDAEKLKKESEKKNDEVAKKIENKLNKEKAAEKTENAE